MKRNDSGAYYAGAFVYLNDTLQTVFHEEGQISKNETYGFVYEYFIKDHQGNIRTVLTDEGAPAAYLATMEESMQTKEDALFSNIYTPVNTVVNKPGGFDNAFKNYKVSRLNADASIDKKTGPGIVLKVMAGDKVLISTYAFYNTATQSPPPGVNLLSELLAAFTGGVISGSGGKVPGGSSSTVSNALSPNVTNFLNNNRPYDNTRPKAFLNWVLVDNQFNLISTVSSATQVLTGSSKQLLVAPTLNIPKNGYLYVYVSNESPQDVYFDDLFIQHEAGPLVQEQSYYPYGLPMYAISDKAALKTNTPYKYNAGSELEEDGIDYYNTFYRKYDAQIGRFTGVDMLAEKFAGINPYQFGANNPVMFNDPSGALTQSEFDNILSYLWNTSFGGTWSSNSSGGSGGYGGGSNVYSFNDDASAKFFGGLIKDGNDISFGTDGNLRMNNSLVQFFNNRPTFNKQINQRYDVLNGSGKKVGEIGLRFRDDYREQVYDYSANKWIWAKGVSMEVGYRDMGSGFTFFNWIQTVQTDVPADRRRTPNGVDYQHRNPELTYKFNDHTDNEPYYNSTNNETNDIKGVTVAFTDSPNRYIGTYTFLRWSAILSLMGGNGSCPDNRMFNISWGFTMDASGNATLMTPSAASNQYDFK